MEDAQHVNQPPERRETDGPLTEVERLQFRLLLREQARRKHEALRLYCPLPHQESFHASMAPERSLRGSNRSGKTLCAAVEFARAVTGQDPFAKYPASGRAIIVGKDEKHLGEVIYPKLFMPGPFRVIRNTEGGEWRAFVPDQDAARRRERRDAPPLIPTRFYDPRKVAWSKKKERIPKKIIIRQGTPQEWEINFFSSLGPAPQGLDVDCLAGWSEVYDPVEGCHRRIDEIDGPFHVLSWNVERGEVEVKRATKPFIKGQGEICRVTLSDGRVIFTTRRHKLLAESGDWVSVQQAFEEGLSLSRADSSGCPDAGIPAGLTQGMCDTPSPVGPRSGSCAARSASHPAGDGRRAPTISRDHAGACALPLRSARGYPASCSTCRRPCDARPRPGVVPCRAGPTSRRDARARIPMRRHSGDRGDTPGSIHARPVCALSPACGPSRASAPWSSVRPPRFAAPSRSASRRPGGARGSRGSSYPPRCIAVGPDRGPGRGVLPSPACAVRSRLHPAIASWRCSASRSGGSASRSPSAPRRTVDGAARPPGRGGDHSSSSLGSIARGCSSTYYVLNIDVICQDWVWDIQVEGNHNYLYEGTISHNCIWFDEEIEHVSWYNEMAMRLVDRADWDEQRGCWIGGKFFWSATPNAGTLKLFEIHKRALEEYGQPHPAVTEHHATLFDNSFIGRRAKDVAVAKLGASEDEAKVRIYGEFALAGMRIYPDFDPSGAHGCEAFPIPESWTRYIGVDPGFRVCAVLFAAVPPDHDPIHGGKVYLYDELYLKGCDAERFGHELSLRLQGQLVWEAVIDHHAGRVTEMGSGRTVEDQYRDALVKRQVRFVGPARVQFVPGSDDVTARIAEVRAGLRVEEGRSVRFVVFRDRLPNLVWEAEHYVNKKDARHGIVTDTPLKINDHLMDCLAMLAAHGLPYRRPPSRPDKGGYAVRFLKEKRQRMRAKLGLGDGIIVG